MTQALNPDHANPEPPKPKARHAGYLSFGIPPVNSSTSEPKPFMLHPTTRTCESSFPMQRAAAVLCPAACGCIERRKWTSLSVRGFQVVRKRSCAAGATVAGLTNKYVPTRGRPSFPFLGGRALAALLRHATTSTSTNTCEIGT